MEVNLFAVVIGGVIGGGGLIVNSLLQRYEHKKAIAAAFHAEIKIILVACEFWKYGNFIQARIENLKDSNMRDTVFPFCIDEKSAFKIYNELAKDIGILDQAIAEKIVLFYGNLNAVLNDMKNATTTIDQVSMALNLNETESRKWLEIAYEIDSVLFKQAIAEGEQLKQKLNRNKLKTIVISITKIFPWIVLGMLIHAFCWQRMVSYLVSICNQ